MNRPRTDNCPRIRATLTWISEAVFINYPLDRSNEINSMFRTKKDISHNTADLENYSALEPLFVDYDYGLAMPRKRSNRVVEYRKRGDVHYIDDFFNE